jgi:putative membrane protein
MKEATLTVDLGDVSVGGDSAADDEETETSLRDKLALDRTYLAKERTVLSYVRTGVTFLGVAFFVYRFMDADDLSKIILTLLFGIPGLYAVSFGMYKTLNHRRDRKEFEEKYMAVRRKWKVKSRVEPGSSAKT